VFEQVNVIKTANVPSDKAWQAISAIGGLDRWFPIINSCGVEGEVVGAIRILGLADGSEIKDCIEEINHQDRRFRYLRTHHPFPVSHYAGTVIVSDAGNGQCKISWVLELEITVQDHARDDLMRFLNRALSDGIAGLEKDLQAQQKN
jgi:hypothetical protein